MKAKIQFLNSTGIGGVHIADLALLGAVIIVAFAYAEGGRMASDIGGWQVDCVVGCAVFSISGHRVGRRLCVCRNDTHATCILDGVGRGTVSRGWQPFFGFVAWYTGMGLGGVARVSQMQYLQPFFTILFSWILLGEKLTIYLLEQLPNIDAKNESALDELLPWSPTLPDEVHSKS